MTTKNSGGAVFPFQPILTGGGRNEYGAQRSGISRRDWLAGLAMQGLLANNEYGKHPPNAIADRAYQQADAMIKEGDE